MKWGGEPREDKERRYMEWREAMNNWHTIFAILPHHTDGGSWVWLQKVERRAISWTMLGSPVWRYREKKEV